MLQLRVNDKDHASAGDTLEEALNKIKIEPTNGVVKIFTKAILKVTKGDKSLERLVFPRQISRIFGEVSKLGREVAMAKITKLVDMLLK